MAALTLFPLQFKRQDSVPIDVDSVFATTVERDAYLTNARRYAGMIVADTELGQVFVLNSARDAWLPISAVSPLTTKGDIYVHNATDDTRLPVGTNGQVLSANSGAATGLAWIDPASSPLTTKGDIYVHNATVDTRLPTGTNGQILSVNTSAATGLAWVDPTPSSAALWREERVVESAPAGPINGITLDELLPDPSTPAAVAGNVTRLDAVVLPEHELHALARPYQRDPAVLIRRLVPTGNYDIVDQYSTAMGTSFAEFDSVGSLRSSFFVSRLNYQLFSSGLTPPPTISLTKTGSEARPLIITSMQINAADTSQTFFCGYFCASNTDTSIASLVAGCIATAGGPASGTNPYTTLVWHKIFDASWSLMSPTFSLVPGIGIAIAGLRSAGIMVTMLNLANGSTVWSRQLDLEFVGPFDCERLRLTPNTATSSGTTYIGLLYAETISLFNTSTGGKTTSRLLTYGPDLSITAAPASSNRGWNAIHMSGAESTALVVVSGQFHNTNIGIDVGYIQRLNVGGTFYDHCEVQDNDLDGWSEVFFNGQFVIAKNPFIPDTIFAAPLKLSTPGNNLSALVADGRGISLAVVTPAGNPEPMGTDMGAMGPTAGLSINIGAAFDGKHFSVIRLISGSPVAYDIDVIDIEGANGHLSTDGGEWEALAWTPFVEVSAGTAASSAANIPSASGGVTASVGTFVALNQPATLNYSETDHIIYGAFTEGGPRPSIKASGVTLTEALRISGANSPGVPTSPIGVAADRAGDIRLNRYYVYYCFQDYDGVSAIWSRAALLGGWSASQDDTPIHTIPVACSDETTALTTGTNKVTFHTPYDFVITEIYAGLTTAQSAGSTFTVDIKQNGSSILSTLLTIDNTEFLSTTAAVPVVISNNLLTDKSKITIDITQVGNGTATGLKVYFVGRRNMF